MKYGGYTGKFLTVDLTTGDVRRAAARREPGREVPRRSRLHRQAPLHSPGAAHRSSGSGERDHLRHRSGHGDDDPDGQPDRRRSQEPAHGHHLGELHGRALRTGAQVRRLGRHHRHRGLGQAGVLWSSTSPRSSCATPLTSGARTPKRRRPSCGGSSGADFRTGAIGPAGENLVLYATFLHVQHAAGRGGPGAVFGAKRLKAVAVRGTGGVEVASPAAEYIPACKELHDIIMENPVREAFRWFGTTGHAPVRQRGRRSALPQPPGRQGPRRELRSTTRRSPSSCSATSPAAAATSSAARWWRSSAAAAPTAASASSTSRSGRWAPTAASSTCPPSWRPPCSATATAWTR